MSGVFVMRIYKCNNNQENRRDSELIGNMVTKNDINKKAVVTDGYINISASDNLKDVSFTTPGSYLCASNATAQAVKNCPLTSAFILVVQYVGSTNTMQTFYEYKGLKVIRRVYFGNAKDWSVEREYTPTTQWVSFVSLFGTAWLTAMLNDLKQAANYSFFEYHSGDDHEGTAIIFKRVNAYPCSGLFIPGGSHADDARVFKIHGIPNDNNSWQYKEIL